MAQIAIIQPAAPQALTTNTTVSDGQSQFSPHLENAISDQQQEPGSQDTSNNPIFPLAGENENLAILEVASQDIPADQSDFATTSPQLFAQIEVIQNPYRSELREKIPTTKATPDSAPVTSQILADSSVEITSPGVEKPTSPLLSVNNSSSTPGSSFQAQFSIDDTADLQGVKLETFAESAKTVATNNLPPAPLTSESEALLARLQKIINSSNEAGTVSITRSGSEGSPTVLASISEPVQLSTNGTILAAGEGLKTCTDRPDQQLGSTRLGSQEQFLEAKVALQNSGKNSENSQDAKQDTGTSPQTLQTAAQNGATGETETVLTFSQASVLGQEQSVQASTETAKPVILPSTTMVHEEEIVQQLIERFQISRKLSDTKINLKLHPVELGELKIDISVKEGSIKANVVAQSQQVQEVIEKNIARLRTVLEEQGFTIDEISVTSESDSVGDFDLFDKQLFSQNDYTPSSGKTSNETGAIFNPEAVLQEESDGLSGVNVRI